MKAIVLIAVLAAVSPLPCAAQAAPASVASISGTVRGADGSVITSGVVSASRIPDFVKLPRTARATAAVTIGPDGSFHFPSLVDGTYQICTQTPGGWISPCLWGAGAGTRTTLSVGQASANVNIVLQKGALVTVRVEDPGQFLTSASAKSSAGLLIGVSTDSLVFHSAALVAQNPGGRTYQVLIPFDRQTSVSIASPALQLADANGNLLASSRGNAIPVLVTSGQPPPTVTLKIVGRVSP